MWYRFSAQWLILLNVIAFLPYVYYVLRVRYSGRERTVAPCSKPTCTVHTDRRCTYFHHVHLLLVVDILHGKTALANKEVHARILLHEKFLCIYT